MPGWIKELADVAIFSGLSQHQKREVFWGMLLVGLLGYAIFSYATFARSSELNAFQQAVGVDMAEVKQTAANVATLATTLAQENLDATKQVRAEVLELQIFNHHIVRCRADDTNLREAYATQVQYNQTRYRRITGQFYPLPSCDET